MSDGALAAGVCASGLAGLGLAVIFIYQMFASLRGPQTRIRRPVSTISQPRPNRAQRMFKQMKMHLLTKALATLAVFAALLILASMVARADTIYTYTSPSFSYDPVLNVDVTLDFATALGDNLTFVDETNLVSSWSMTDGDGHSLDASDAQGLLINLSTNASGQIISWSIGACIDCVPGETGGTSQGSQELYTNEGSVLDPHVFGPYDATDETLDSFVGTQSTTQAGTWSETVSPTPEPSLDALILFVVLGAAVAWKFHADQTGMKFANGDSPGDRPALSGDEYSPEDEPGDLPPALWLLILREIGEHGDGEDEPGPRGNHA